MKTCTTCRHSRGTREPIVCIRAKPKLDKVTGRNIYPNCGSERAWGVLSMLRCGPSARFWEAVQGPTQFRWQEPPSD